MTIGFVLKCSATGNIADASRDLNTALIRHFDPKPSERIIIDSPYADAPILNPDWDARADVFAVPPQPDTNDLVMHWRGQARVVEVGPHPDPRNPQIVISSSDLRAEQIAVAAAMLANLDPAAIALAAQTAMSTKRPEAIADHIANYRARSVGAAAAGDLVVEAAQACMAKLIAEIGAAAHGQSRPARS